MRLPRRLEGTNVTRRSVFTVGSRNIRGKTAGKGEGEGSVIKAKRSRLALASRERSYNAISSSRSRYTTETRGSGNMRELESR
jgi:hypothetical protein